MGLDILGLTADNISSGSGSNWEGIEMNAKNVPVKSYQTGGPIKTRTVKAHWRSSPTTGGNPLPGMIVLLGLGTIYFAIFGVFHVAKTAVAVGFTLFEEYADNKNRPKQIIQPKWHQKLFAHLVFVGMAIFVATFSIAGWTRENILNQSAGTLECLSAFYHAHPWILLIIILGVALYDAAVASIIKASCLLVIPTILVGSTIYLIITTIVWMFLNFGLMLEKILMTVWA